MIEKNEPIGLNVEIEKYKIDKMIENGLIKEQNMVSEKWYQLILATFSERKFLFIYCATLWFIFALFNSSKYWNFHMR